MSYSHSRKSWLGSHFRRGLSPPLLLLYSFAAAIAAGTALLLLPWCTNGDPLGLVDAVFTATSAVCVTGLVVADTGSRFSHLGQIIILVLIQAGGLGIMTFSALLFTLTHGSIPIKSRLAATELLDPMARADLKRLIGFVLGSTFLIESTGTLLLWARWSHEFGPLHSLYLAVFHSVSAFCNAGFSLFTDGMMHVKSDTISVLTVAILIILGGLGFLVLDDLRKQVMTSNTRQRLSLHTKIVLVATVVLIVLGFANFLVMEHDNVLTDMSLGNRIVTALFQSITTRTAGFNTVDISLLSNETLFIFMILMFIGASPGSTGGGIKTTTAAILFSVFWSRIRGLGNPTSFKRTIPQDTMSRAISIVLVSLSIVVTVTILLLITELGELSHQASRGKFIEIFFETVSAFGTVGLSTGVTPDLSSVGRVIVAVTMFVGRVGPLTLAAGLLYKKTPARIRYAEEEVVVG